MQQKYINIMILYLVCGLLYLENGVIKHCNARLFYDVFSIGLLYRIFKMKSIRLLYCIDIVKNEEYMSTLPYCYSRVLHILYHQEINNFFRKKSYNQILIKQWYQISASYLHKDDV